MADDTNDLLKRLIAAVEDNTAYTKNFARDIQSIKSMIVDIVRYMKEAESEVPEKMRRFIMYMHDVHDVMNMYTELGQPVPPHILREAERCDDRYRQLLEDGHTDGGWTEKIRQEMSKRTGNRWDHTRILPNYAGVTNDTGKVESGSVPPETGPEDTRGERGPSGSDRPEADRPKRI